MPQQFTFKSYVPKPAPEAKQRAVDTMLPSGTNARGKTLTLRDGVDAQSRAVLPHEVNAVGAKIDKLVRSDSMGDKTIAACNPSAVSDTELQLREVVQENSIPLSRTENDFEDWLRQDKPSPEQPKNKRIQQPTPDYDGENTDDARRKRPRLTGGVCPNTLGDRGATAGAYQKERGAESDPEGQATVQELASPIKFGQFSKDRSTATNCPTPHTPSNNAASQSQGDGRITERAAYICTTQTRSLISALARAAAAPLPRDDSNLKARVSSSNVSAGSCAVSAYQTAVQKPALAKQPMTMLTQRLPGDQQAADLVDRDASMDQRAANLDQQATDLANRAASMDQRAADLDQQATDLANRAASMDQRAADLDQQAADLADRAASMDQRVIDLDRRAAGLDQRAASMDQRAAIMDQRFAALDQRAADMDQRALDMDGPAAKVWQRSADLEERDADRNQRVADPHQQARASPRQLSRASNQTLARQRCNMEAVGHFDDCDDCSGGDDASVCENEEDTNFSRGRLSQKEKIDLIQWSDQGKPLDWIAKQLNRRRENIEKLEKDARKLGIV